MNLIAIIGTYIKRYIQNDNLTKNIVMPSLPPRVIRKYDTKIQEHCNNSSS